jgi:hypothetical protein
MHVTMYVAMRGNVMLRAEHLRPKVDGVHGQKLSWLRLQLNVLMFQKCVLMTQKCVLMLQKCVKHVGVPNG